MQFIVKYFIIIKQNVSLKSSTKTHEKLVFKHIF